MTQAEEERAVKVTKRQRQQSHAALFGLTRAEDDIHSDVRLSI